MSPAALGLAALLAAAPAEPAPSILFTRQTNHLFLLQVRGDDGRTNYAVYRTVDGGSGSLVVQRSRGVLSDRDRAQMPAGRCPGVQPLIEALERLPWPGIDLTPPPSRPYRERGQYVGYTFYGTIGFPDATSWEVTLSFVEVRGEPPQPFAAWAGELVRVVDTCLARPA